MIGSKHIHRHRRSSMNNKDIEWKRKKLESMRKEIESGQLNALRELLPDEAIRQICEESGYYFRTRLLTPLVTVFHMIAAGISREASFQSAWQMNGQTGRSGVLSEARKRLPLEVWIQLHEWMMKEIETEVSGSQLWHGHRMIGVDGTGISMSDEPRLAQEFGRWNSKHGLGRFPMARAVVAFNLETLINMGHQAGPCRMSETELNRRLIKHLRTGDVIIFDRLYSGANLYVEYQRTGIEFIGRAHACSKIERLTVVEVLGAGDLVVEMPIEPRRRRQDPSLPKTIQVRVIQTRATIDGKQEDFWIATSLLDPVKYPKQEIQAWQKKRWKIETLIEEMKIWLGADILRSKSPEGIYKELYARIVGLNLIHWLILKAAQKHNKPIERISTSAALRLTAAYSLKMSTAPAWQLAELYRTLLERIDYSTIPDRPNRIEPRMIRRDPKHYPMLKMTRKEWCQSYAIAA